MTFAPRISLAVLAVTISCVAKGAEYQSRIAFIFVMLFAGSVAIGQIPSARPSVDFGGTKLEGWSNTVPATDGGILSVPGASAFRFPDGAHGFFKHGFRLENDGTVDFRPYYGLRFDVKLPDAREAELTVAAIAIAPNGADKTISSTLRVSGTGWHTLNVPWASMEFDHARTSFLKFGKGASISARFTDDSSGGAIAIRDVRLVKAPAVALEAEVCGKSAATDGEVSYDVTVSNCTDQPQSVALSFVKDGWQTMDATVEPVSLNLPARGSQHSIVRVRLNSRVAIGGHERQVLLAIPNGDESKARQIAFVTTCQLPHPYILHTPARWQEVRDKVKNYSWAKEAQDDIVRRATNWKVPEVAAPPRNDPNDTYGPFLFATVTENDLLACAFAWQLAGDKACAQKVADYLLRLSNPQYGYPVTLRGCNQSLVQEGHFFQHSAMAYDMILDSDVLSDADRAQIEQTFRIFMTTIDFECSTGSINNWNLSEACGALYCALAIEDLSAADRFFAGTGGIKDELVHGTMDDGWWYECSIGYNLWCASEFTQAALAMEPFGFNFKNEWLPAIYSPKVLISAELNGGNSVDSPEGGPSMKGKPFGMDPTLYGPNRRTYRTITDLWDSLLPFIDYRGVMFGVNDSAESKVGGNRTEVSGQPFEIAYYAFRDPKYASMIKLGGGKRDLLYAVPELPEKTPELFRDSAVADNVGLVMLRSQTPDRPIREQIQAALHYGTHGWAHGHFDRTDLLCLMRYGRNFWNPESVFWAYEPFMYKFYCQTSLNHNMVVVDDKMQEPTPGERVLFHLGKAMQATVVQTTARWANPPYGGMVYDYVPVKTFAEKCWREGRSVPSPENPPRYGTMTDFSEPILQRRAMIVTDDYVVLADYLKATKPHTFDDLLQLKGFLGINAPEKKFLRHDAQWDPNPIGSAQFVTDCNWYSSKAPSIARVETQFGPGTDQAGNREVGNEPGSLKLNVHTLWPRDQQLMVGAAPEQHDVEKRLFYEVRGDGKVLADGKLGAWILGKADIDVPIEGVQELELQTRTELSKKPTLFWAGARVVTGDGKELPVASFPMTADNVVASGSAGQDYFGGPIKIAGDAFTDGVAAEPKDAIQPGMIRVDLKDVGAVRFKATLGSDYPPGPEAQRRKVFAIRSHGSEAQFLTLIEPFEETPVVKSAEASDATSLRVTLKDGRVQLIEIAGFGQDAKQISIRLRELDKEGRIICEETTTGK